MASARGVRAGRAYVELFADSSKLVRGLRHASRRLKAWGASVRQMGMGIAAVGAAALAGLGMAGKSFADFGDRIAKMAKRTGFTVETLSELDFAASQTGASIEKLEPAIRRMQRSIYDAGRGLSTQVDAFADIGLAVENLAGLSPEKQFRKIADAIGGIEDPTRRAAIAQALLGRSGTVLLPMFAAGAAGMEAMRQKAHALGLTLSDEDAASAEELTDAMDAAGRSMKRAVTQIGGAMAPLLTQIGEKMAEVAAKAGKWVKENRGLIVSIAKIAGIVVVGGAAFAVLGTILSGLGSVIGMVGAVLGLLLSPIGLVVAAVAGLGAWFLSATGSMGKATDWLSEKFGQLKDFAGKSFGGIADALKAGDIGLAAKILWLSLRLAWETGIKPLKEMWAIFKYWFIETGLSIWYELQKGLGTIWAGLKKGWNETCRFFERAWNGVTKSIQKAGSWLWDKLRQGWEWVVGKVTGKSDKHIAAKQKAIDEEGRKFAEGLDAEYNAMIERQDVDRKAEQTEHDDFITGLNNQKAEALAMVAKDKAKEIAAAQGALDAATKEWTDAIAEARRKREAAEKGQAADGGPPGVGEMPQAPPPPKLGPAMTRGTFSSSALWGMGSDSTSAKIAEATKKTAESNERIAIQVSRVLHAVQNNQAVFSGI